MRRQKSENSAGTENLAQEPSAFRLYPFELVANVAATLAAVRPPLVGGLHLREAADDAIKLLQGCDESLARLKEKIDRESGYRPWIWVDAGEKYPVSSYKRELLRMIKRDSEPEALPG